MGKLLERAAPTVELMAGHATAAGEGCTTRERVVDDEPDLDERGAALAMFACTVPEKPERRGQDARERREDRDRGLQRAHVMRCDPQQRVALGHRLVDQAELAVLEVADAAMDHVRRGRGRTADIVGPLRERHIHALHREVAEGRQAVDSPADDEHVGIGARREGLEAVRWTCHLAPSSLRELRCP
jgi:hypothetical protein